MAIEKIKILGADYSFELIFNETCAPQFNGHNNSFLTSVLAVRVVERIQTGILLLKLCNFTNLRFL